MVWGAITDKKKSKLVDLKEGETNKCYFLENICNGRLLHFASQVQTPIFMQDSAPVYRFKVIQNWIKQQDFENMKWLPYSPDLNPMESSWAQIKKYLRSTMPQPKTQEEMENLVLLTAFLLLINNWSLMLCCNLPPSKGAESTLNSMFNRLHSVSFCSHRSQMCNSYYIL